MRNLIFLIAAMTVALLPCNASAAGRTAGEKAAVGLDFSKTLRIDYIFTGTASTQSIALAELCSIDSGWAGRRVNLDKLPVQGNGQVVMWIKSEGSDSFDKLVYEIPFSSLFQEWQTTEEATKIVKSFENVVLLPMPSVQAEVTLSLFNFKGGVACEHKMTVDPKDILIRPVGARPAEHEWIWKGGESLDSELRAQDRIDVAIVAEGYTQDEMDMFMEDARLTMESLWAHEPFASMKKRFNIVAVKCPSRDCGVSVPHEDDWKDTAVSSSFDTFYSARYLTTGHLFKLHDLLAGIPYEHIIILANTDTYGGGGIFNSYTLTTAHHPGFKPVVVHEFGHSFAGLADEYFYDDGYSPYYFQGVEPWEANITTQTDFDSKWKWLVGKEFPLGSSKDFGWDGKTSETRDKVGLHEGGGYLSKGVWRACDNCRMRTNTYPAFCPVCQHAIREIIDFYTKEQR